MSKKNHTGNIGLFIIMTAVYVGLLMLFAWQTWQFVNWLFPDDQILMKILTVLCFDIMALLWSCLDLFYRFASRGARTLVRWAWAISFILSLLASVFYLIIESMFRFQVTLTQSAINVGYGISIVAVTLQVLFVTFWLYLEWNVRHPHMDEYETIEPDGHDPERGGKQRNESETNEILQQLLAERAERNEQIAELRRMLAEQNRASQPSVQAVSIVNESETNEPPANIRLIERAKSNSESSQSAKGSFVRKCLMESPDIRNSEIIQKANENGISLSPGYVSDIRKSFGSRIG
jgi:hypothetical protein